MAILNQNIAEAGKKRYAFALSSTKVFSDLAQALLISHASKATKYFSEKLTVKAKRKLFEGKIYRADRRIEIIFTLGVPNYQEREFIKKRKKAGEPFPIKKIQLKYPPNSLTQRTLLLGVRMFKKKFGK